ncbi:NADP-dependent oxidoreductase [Terriglobus saanensis]|uniref:Alcohol dehydrogenase GroES domain protein n=1 Tax=Terriglobus saanensis (strain ATCC BAA-1853 / DSM 23119 / SP1PR4) TaxID=401053 RepID=E8V651_TERSS|nr:NADP-dependent oxidoreductase [Terriglobus saanensis]ADV84942.1 Alcohol dehydrogenase GroES domain protein [Terriglobus saanensis SP1PR4]
MKAVLLYEFGGPEKLKYVTDAHDPEIAPHEILIASTAVGVNPIDYKMRNGSAQARSPISFPAILGRDVSGIVRAIGSEVSGVAVGDRVMALTHHTYAELVVAQAGEVTHVPEGLDLVQAAALPLVALTGDQLVRFGAKVQSGQTVLITGALGSVGRAAIHTAKKLGAHVIAGVRKHSLEAAKELGADTVLALDDPEALEKLGFVDAVADTVGGHTADILMTHVKQGGVFGTVVTPIPDHTLNPTIELNHIMSQPDSTRVREFAEDLRDGKFILPIDRMIALAEATEAHIALEKEHVSGKVLLLVL